MRFRLTARRITRSIGEAVRPREGDEPRSAPRHERAPQVRAVSFAAAIALAGLLAACGSSHPSTVASTITRAQFIVRADAICKASEARLAPVLATEASALSGQSPNALVGGEALDKAQAIVRAGIAALRALPEPNADRTVLSRLFGAVGREAGALGTLATDFRESKTSAATAVEKEVTADSSLYRAIAAGYGFKRCGVHAGSG
jgi:hypothetical protein